MVKSLNIGVVKMEKHSMGSLIVLKGPSLNQLTMVAIVTWQIYKYRLILAQTFASKDIGCVDSWHVIK